MELLQRDLKAVGNRRRSKCAASDVRQPDIRKLQENASVAGFLKNRQRKILSEFDKPAATESLLKIP